MMKELWPYSSLSSRFGKLGTVLVIFGIAALSVGRTSAEAAMVLSPNFNFSAPGFGSGAVQAGTWFGGTGGEAASGFQPMRWDDADPVDLSVQLYLWGPFKVGSPDYLAHNEGGAGPRLALNLGRPVPLEAVPALPSNAVLFGSGLFGLFGIVIRRDGLLKRQELGSGSCAWQSETSNCISILLVSCDSMFANPIEEQLQRSGYRVRTVQSMTEALAGATQLPPKMVLVDRRVSDWDMLRTETSLKEVPVLTLVPLGEVESEADVLSDLERGADGVHLCRDGYGLLLARVGAYLRRAGHQLSRRGVYRVGSVRLDADIREVTVAGEHIQLSAKPFAILEALMRAPSKVFSRSELVDLVWGRDFAIGEHTLDVHVHAIRQVLDRDPEQGCRLVAIKGVGFKLKPASVAPYVSATEPVLESPRPVRSAPGLIREAVQRVPSQVSSLTTSIVGRSPQLRRIPRRKQARALRRSTAVRPLHGAVSVG